MDQINIEINRKKKLKNNIFILSLSLNRLFLFYKTLIMNINTIQERFDSSLKIILNFWTKYLLFNLIVIVVWLLIFLGLISIIAMIYWINYTDFNFNNYTIIWWFIMYLFIFLIMSWLLSSILFLWNFYITKNIIEEKKIPTIKQLFSIILHKLVDKVKVDFWYFLVFLPIVFVLILTISIIALSHNYSFISLYLVFLFLLIIPYIYILVSFYLSYYYSFDKERFTFKDFLESRNITNWKKMSLLGNIILISILTYIISQIIMLIFSSILKINYTSWLAWYIIVAFVKYILSFFVWIFSFIYFYLYYLHLIWYKVEKTSTENKKGESGIESKIEERIEK